MLKKKKNVYIIVCDQYDFLNEHALNCWKMIFKHFWIVFLLKSLEKNVSQCPQNYEAA